MGLWLITILIALGSAAGIIFPIYRQSKGGGSETVDMSDLDSKISALDGELESLSINSNDFASKGQVDFIDNQIADIKAAIEAERSLVVEIEDGLKRVQGEVEQKESHQQAMKSSNDDDDTRVQRIIADYQPLTEEAISLEQSLAQSLKDLDSIRSAHKLNPEQNSILQLLSDSFEAAGGRIRDLLTEYETIHRRVSSLQTQKEELEEEYTRLVERQLGT